MTATTNDSAAADDADLTAADVAWNLADLLDGADDVAALDALLDRADELAASIAAAKGTIGDLDVAGLAAHMALQAELGDVLGRAGSWAGLRFATDTATPEHGATMQKVQERSTAIETKLLFFELEWAELDDARIDELLAEPAAPGAVDPIAPYRHYLRSMRRYKDHLLTEAEERILSEKSPTANSAWVRLFSELTSEIRVDLPGTGEVSLELGLATLQHPDREVRRGAAAAVTAGLAPGLRTRAFLFNTLLHDKATDDRLRSYPSWISARNLANEASDESVAALVAAVQRRYGIAQRWYALKARILGVERLADYDRMASVATAESAPVGWAEARDTVLDAYGSFSPTMAGIARRFFDDRWIDAPLRPAKRPGAFCAYTTPDVHPYVLLNWTGKRNDVLTLAHELGHGLHAYLARPQGIFHQSTPLTLAETASVFGETVTFGRLLEQVDDPDERLSLLAENLEGAIATVFRQIAMNRFEDAVHSARRDEGELSVERFGDLWAQSQTEMLGDAVEVTDGYRTWWSYIPHFIGTPGYVYAYAYGQLLALSVYKRYVEQGPDFVERYERLLAAGGSLAPEQLAAIVDCDLADPGFWDGGLDIVEGQLTAAEAAARDAGRL